jgi:hypothetical protein
VLVAVVSRFEQRVNINFFCKLGKSALETLVGLSALYGDKALKESAVYFSFSYMPFLQNITPEFWGLFDPSMHIPYIAKHRFEGPTYVSLQLAFV